MKGPTSGLVDRIRRDAEDRWRTPWKRARLVSWVVLVGTVVVFAAAALYLADIDLPFRFLTNEDSILEWAQFAFFLGGAILAVSVAVSHWRAGRRILAVFYVVVGVALLFIAGEEISWGQRLLGLETPDGLLDINTQDEITLHNIEGVLFYFNLAMMLVGFFGFIAPLVALRRPFKGFLEWVTPPAYTVLAFAAMGFYKLWRFTLATESRFVVNRLGEWAEFCLALGILVFLIEIRRRTVRERTTVAQRHV